MSFSRYLNSLVCHFESKREHVRRKRRVASLDAVERLEDRALLTAFSVNSIADAGDANPGDGLAQDALGNTTLRAAIEEANALPGQDAITFNISGAGLHTIQPTSALPVITDVLSIDGTTQPGFGTTPLIELDGSVAGAGVDGLRVIAGNSTIKGLAINRFDQSGIVLQTGGENLIALNHIGTDPSGTVALSNGSGIAVLDSANNTIGDPFLAGAGSNVISGNTASNIFFSGPTTTGNAVQSNWIGLDVTGTTALGGNFGVTLVGGATGNTIGGDHPLHRNDISGNDRGVGIGSDAPGNVVRGNFIGPESSGTGSVGNSVNGVVVGSANNHIIGNVISANPNAGVLLSGSLAVDNFIMRNHIGTTAMPVSGSNVSPLPNGYGVLIELGASGNSVGGPSQSDANTIAFNNLDGIRVVGDDSRNNTVIANSIHSNERLGINLADPSDLFSGVTPNDVGDGDGGPNTLQNFPVLSAVQAGGNTLVAGHLNGLPKTSFRIDVFASAVADPSGHGEGERFLDTFSVSTDPSGNAFFAQLLPAATAVGESITATATRIADTSAIVPILLDTSEFSATVSASAGAFGIFDPVSGLLSVFGTENVDRLQLHVESDGSVIVSEVSDPDNPVPVPIHPPDPIRPPIIPMVEDVTEIVAALREGDDIFTLIGDSRLQASIDVNGDEGDDGIDLNIFGFNPQPEPPKFLVSVDGGGGNNAISVNADGRSASSNIPIEFHVVTAAGSDVIDLNIIGFNPQPEPPKIVVAVDAGDGNNQIDLNVASGQTPDDGMPAPEMIFDLRTGVGADMLNASLDPRFAHVLFDATTEGGNDVVDLNVVAGNTPDDSRPAEFHISAGAGDNLIDLNVVAGTTPDDGRPAEFSVLAGPGADTLRASFRDLTADLMLGADLGDGNNQIDLNVVGGNPPDDGMPAPEMIFDLRTGDGVDTLHASLDPQSTHVLFDATTEGGNDVVDLNVVAGTTPDDGRPAEFHISAGAGDNLIDLNVVAGNTPDDNRPAEFSVLAGPGADTLRASFRDLTADLMLGADLGDGNNQIDLNVVGGTPPDDSTPAPQLGFNLNTGAGADVINTDFDGLVDTVLNIQAMLGDGADVLAKSITGMRGGRGNIDVHVSGEGGNDLIMVDYGYFDGGYGVLESPLSVFVEGGDGVDRITKRFSHVTTRAPLNVMAVGGGDDDAITGIYEHIQFEAPHAVYLFGDHQSSGEDDAGNDQLKLLYGDVSFTAAAPVLNTFDGGDGDDELTYVLDDEAEALDLTLMMSAGAGEDEIKTLLHLVADNLIADIDIALGRGADEADFEMTLTPLTGATSDVDINTEIHGDDGNDTIKALLNLSPTITGRLRFEVHGDDDDDELGLCVFGAEAVDQLFLLLNGGDGFDSGRATSNVMLLSLEEFKSPKKRRP